VAVRFIDFRKEYGKRLDNATAFGLRKGAERLVQLVQRRVSKRYPPASKPGRPPRRRTGKLRKNIAFFMRGRRSRNVTVGWRKAGIYGFYHESGINYPKAGLQFRKHMLPVFRRHKKHIGNVITRNSREKMRHER